MAVTFSDQYAASQMRDVIKSIVKAEMDLARPKDRYATVQSVDRPNRKATVRFVGETADVVVGMGAIQPFAGQTVRIAGLPGDRHVEDVLGPPFLYLPDGSVVTSTIGDDQVTAAKIADNAIATAHIQDDAVTGAEIADSAIATAHLANLAVTAAKMAAIAVSERGLYEFADATERDAAFTDDVMGQMCVIDGHLQWNDGFGWLEFGNGFTSYTPTYTNYTVGNGTSSVSFCRMGIYMNVVWDFVLGSTSAVSAGGTITVPTGGDAFMHSGTFITNRGTRGWANFVDSAPTPTGYAGYTRVESATTLRVLTLNLGGTYPVDSGISSTVPFTWATGDVLHAEWIYLMDDPYV